MVQVKAEHFRALSHYYAAVALCEHTREYHNTRREKMGEVIEITDGTNTFRFKPVSLYQRVKVQFSDLTTPNWM